jgi:hypothetical protein
VYHLFRYKSFISEQETSNTERNILR